MEVFVDVLGFGAVLKILKYLFISRVKKIVIHYRTVLPRSEKIINLLKNWRYDLELKSFQMDNTTQIRTGGAVWYWVHKINNDVAHKITEKLSEQGIYPSWIPELFSENKKMACVRQIIASEIYKHITMALFASEQKKNNKDTRYIVFMKISDLYLFAKAELNKWIEGVEFVNIFDVRNFFIARVFVFLKEEVEATIRYGLSGFRKWKFESQQPHRVAVQYYCSGQWADHSWYDATGLSPDQLVVYFNQGEKNPVTEKIMSDLESRGYRTAILNQSSKLNRMVGGKDYSSIRVRYVIRDLVSFAKILFAMFRIRAPFWQFSQWVALIRAMRKMQTFLVAENIKVVSDRIESIVDYVSLAAEAVGGIKIGMHRGGDLFYPRSHLVPLHHVYCTWGPAYSKVVMEGLRAATEVVLEVGCLPNNEELRLQWDKSGLEYKSKLRESGATTILGVLDRICVWDGLLPPYLRREFFEKILAWVEKDKSIAVIIKCDEPGVPEFPGSAEFKDIIYRINNLQNEGRLIFLENEKNVFEFTSVLDLAICLGPTSAAGINSLIAGTPVLFWDPTGFCEGPFIEWAESSGWRKSNLIYGDMDNVIKTARMIFQHDAGVLEQINSGIKKIFHEFTGIDDFRDGMAERRIAEFVCNFIHALSLGMSRDLALAEACKKHVNYHGVERAKYPLKT